MKWWRAQSIKYITRPHPWLLDYVESEKKKVFAQQQIPHPIISLHVRHGDKWREAVLMNLTSYIEEIRKSEIVRKVRRLCSCLLLLRILTIGMHLQYSIRDVFVSTEDPQVIAELPAYEPEFRFHFTNVTRLNMSPYESSATLGRMQEFLISWTQLYIAVQCDIFVGTRTSNWCRLIDELRKVNGKASTPYLSPAADQEYEY